MLQKERWYIEIDPDDSYNVDSDEKCFDGSDDSDEEHFDKKLQIKKAEYINLFLDKTSNFIINIHPEMQNFFREI